MSHDADLPKFSFARGVVFSIVRLSFLVSTFVFLCVDQCHSQTETSKGLTTVTGILLVSGRTCEERSENHPKDKETCPEGSSRWGLLTLTKQYSVRGNARELKQYERRSVTVTGTVSRGREAYIDKLDVQSIGPNDIVETQIRNSIEELRRTPWTEPANVSNPTFWVFNFTRPMLEILQAGPAAQDILLEYLDDPQIKDQIILLLGGVGDQKSVGPIIHAMADPGAGHDSVCARKLDLAANLALTNITVSEVIWHHGGGITLDRCPHDPKSCWGAWWVKNEGTFDLAKTANRNYSNYPGYGIYQEPGVFRSESFR